MIMTSDRPAIANPLLPAEPSHPGARQLPPTRIAYTRSLCALLRRDLHHAPALLAVQWLFAATATLALYYATILFDYTYRGVGISLLVYPPFLTIAAIFFPLCGLALGLLLSRQDATDPDFLAFLYHRPVPRHLHASARLLAAGLLYLLGAGIPCAVAITLSATRTAGIFFITPFLYPSLALFLLGAIVCITALLTVHRRARWYATKFLPLLIPLLVAAALYHFPAFRDVLLALTAVAALLTTAFYAAITTQGFTLRTPAWAKTCLAATLLLALTLPAFVAAQSLSAATTAWFGGRTDVILTDYFLRHPLPPPPRAPAEPESVTPIDAPEFRLLADGSLVLETDKPTPGSSTWKSTFTDLQGRPIPDPTALAPMLISIRARMAPNPGLPELPNYRTPAARLLTADLPADPAHHLLEESWFFSDNLFYGYDTRTHAAIAILGRDGPASPSHPPTPFLASDLLLYDDGTFPMSDSPTAALAVDLRARTVHLLLTATDPILDIRNYSNPLVIATRLRLYSVERDGTSRSFPLIPTLDQAPIAFSPLPQLHQYVIQRDISGDAIFDFFNADGSLAKSLSVSLPRPPDSPDKAARLAYANAYDAYRHAMTVYRQNYTNLALDARLASINWQTNAAVSLAQGISGILPRAALRQAPLSEPIDFSPVTPLPFFLPTAAALAATLLLARRRLTKKSTLAWSLLTLVLGPITPLALLATAPRS